jgi:cell division protein FtsQ
LQSLDWVESAVVIRRFPNQLQIAIAEREPFVVWQHDGQMEVVDQSGKPMTGVSLSSNNMLLHVVGEGANTAASLLVNQMSASPGLMQEVKAAVRVGDRRWDLHMNSGLVIQLPEDDTAKAMKIAESNYLSGAFKTLPLQSVDFRLAGQTGFFALEASTLQPADPTTTSSIQ